MNHILITGGTGFIGQALCRALLAQGHRLSLLVRDMPKARRLFGERVQLLTLFEALNGADAPVDLVINLAGEPVLGPRWTAARKAQLLASRCGVTDALVAWIAGAARKPRLMISASAIGYYGVQSLDDDSDWAEDQPGQAIFMSTLCQRWEASARAVEAQGVPLARLRLGVVLAAQGGALPKMLLPIRLGLGGPTGHGRQVLSWIHLADVLAIIEHLIALPATAAQGAFNATAPDPVRQMDFVRSAARLLRRPAVLPVPAFVLRALLGEQAELLTEGQRVVPARLLASGYRFRFASLDAALADCLK